MENYNKLLEKAREAYSKSVTGAEKRRLESIFPELVESLDEKIRKEILDYFKDLYEHGYPTKEWVAWIEKQDKKEIDKVELCFDHSPELKGQDGKMLESIIECIDGTGLLDSDQIDWLKSFKDKCSIKDDKALLEKRVEQADYNPYKATIESIAAMVERYADNGDLKDFYDNIKVKCKDAMEYGKTLSEKRGEQKLVWSEEDNGFVDLLLAIFTNMHPNELFTTNNITVFNGDNVSSGRIATWLKSFKDKCKDVIEYNKALLENKNKDGKVIFPKFTFDDVLALECCMKMTEKEEELHEQLQSLHDRVHDVYQPDKKGNSAQEEIKERDLFKFRDSVSKATKEGRDFFKFHKGDWIVHNDKKEVFFIKNISCGYLSLEGVDGITHYPCLPLDSEFHHWTIEDVKDGDVLANKYGVIFINDGNRGGKATLDSYCYLSVQYEFCINEHKTDCWLYKDDIKPATKEQRDFFFAKMKKAGYEWDSENKELRKQCNQESIDKVEAKFKVGDWVVCDGLKTALIVNIDDDKYEVEFIDGDKGFPHIVYIDRLFHHWTIEDAKDGDVVVDKSNGTIGIFQSIGHDPDGGSHNDPSYCFLHCRYVNGFFYADFENGNMIDADDLIPAIKEQRDILFAKMAEAGYEWDPKNKSLGKQCNKELNNLKSKFKVGDWIVHNGVGVYKIVEVCESWYEVISYNNDGIVIQYSIGFDKENDCRLWTIQDAKNGDVLANTARCILIANDNKSCLCYLDKNEKFHAHNNKWLFSNFSDNVLTPATKEQRDLLFSKMKEAGYEWDAKNKELRKRSNPESNKVGPKFKVGDWVIGEGFNPILITDIKNNRYEFEFIDGTKRFSGIDCIDSDFNLWTIEDAKDGDVLAGHECYVLFKNIAGLNIRCHCTYHYMGYNPSFHVETLQNKTAFRPATNEQRDLLLQKIEDAGYEWDAKNKELRKQCNQESIVRAYPKFKVGDWIVHNDVSVYKIIEVCESWYEVISYNGETGKQYSIGFDNENNCHLWTIEDAKEGDVLAWDGSMCLALFKSIYNKEDFCSYGLVGHCTQSFENREGFHDIEGAHPATKEQRDLFFQKMKEAGYEWNAKNKELRKQCNQEPVDKVGPKFQKGQWIFHEGFHPMFIVNIDGDKYEIEFTDNGTKGTQPIDFIDKICHLWTIEDAKEGDVLAIGNTYFLFKGAIFKSFPTSPTVYISHCFAHATGAFRLTNGMDCGKFHAIEDGIEVCPATKEERDLLFHKMKEAGYEWDAKKKEMVKEINYK